MDPHTFEHNGAMVDYLPATVRTELEKRRIQIHLLRAFNVMNSEDLETNEWANISEYAAAMAQSKSAAPWWCNSNAGPEKIRAAYELFMEQDTALYDKFLHANLVTAPPKKTEMSTSET